MLFVTAPPLEDGHGPQPADVGVVAPLFVGRGVDVFGSATTRHDLSGLGPRRDPGWLPYGKGTSTEGHQIVHAVFGFMI